MLGSNPNHEETNSCIYVLFALLGKALLQVKQNPPPAINALAKDIFCIITGMRATPGWASNATPGEIHFMTRLCTDIIRETQNSPLAEQSLLLQQTMHSHLSQGSNKKVSNPDHDVKSTASGSHSA